MMPPVMRLLSEGWMLSQPLMVRATSSGFWSYPDGHWVGPEALGVAADTEQRDRHVLAR